MHGRWGRRRSWKPDRGHVKKSLIHRTWTFKQSMQTLLQGITRSSYYKDYLFYRQHIFFFKNMPWIFFSAVGGYDSSNFKPREDRFNFDTETFELDPELSVWQPTTFDWIIMPTKISLLMGFNQQRVKIHGTGEVDLLQEVLSVTTYVLVLLGGCLGMKAQMQWTL